MPTTLGIDVGVRKGLDLVLMDETLAIKQRTRRFPPEDLPSMLDRIDPDVVAIDSPPGWGRGGGTRATERTLRELGVMSYGTPSDPRKGDSPFYGWMKQGFRTFEFAARCGYRRYRAGPIPRTAIEVFPHATAVALAGCLPPEGVRKRDWRASILDKQGVVTEDLRSPDQVDAALAALTGILALQGIFVAPGDPDEGVIVVPVIELPSRPYRRAVAEATPEGQPALPGFRPCRCGEPGCTALTAREFAPGHDAKRKSVLWRTARLGDEAVRELEGRNWLLPTEMR